MSEATPTAPATDSPQSKSLRPLRELLGFLWPHKSRLIIASAALVFTAVTQLSLGYGIQVLIDQGFSNQSEEGLRRAVLFMVAVGFAMAWTFWIFRVRQIALKPSMIDRSRFTDHF